MESAAPDLAALRVPDLLVAVCAAPAERLSANEAWCEVFGDGALWDRLPPEDRRFVGDYLAEAAQGLLVTNQLFLVDTEKQELALPVQLNFLPVRTPDRRPGDYEVVVTGEPMQIPTSWAAEQTRRRRMEMLGQMSMGIAHDFNNLLTGILGNTQLLKRALAETALKDAAHAEAMGYLATLEQAATDGAALVRKIQGYIRHEKQERFEPLDLSRLASDVIDLTRPYWHNEPRRQGIRIDLERSLQDVPPILGFPTELREVLVNLILNAVQAMPEGGTLQLTTRTAEPARVEIEVGDTGTGMDDGVRHRIFEPMFTTKGERGTGMGLAVSFGIVQEHRGTIDVATAPGEGTRFTLSFPASTDAPSAPPAASRPEPAAGTYRLLVVDDEPMVRTVTARLLRLKGHDVAEATGGKDALDHVAESPFDLVLTDLSMPEMNGRELAFRLRQHHPHQPIVLLTGDTDAEDLSEHVDAVVKKPFQLDELDALIHRVVTGAP